MVGKNVSLVREDITLDEEECWVGGGGCFGEDVVGIWNDGYRIRDLGIGSR